MKELFLLEKHFAEHLFSIGHFSIAAAEKVIQMPGGNERSYFLKQTCFYQ